MTVPRSRQRRKRFVLVLAAACLPALSALARAAQQPATTTTTAPATAPTPTTAPAPPDAGPGFPKVDELEAQLAQAEARTDLAEPVQKELVGALRQTIDQLNALETWRTAIAEHQASITNAPGALAEHREFIANFSPTPVEPPADASLADLEARLAAAETALRDAQAEVDRVASHTETRKQRRETLAGLLAQVGKNLADTQAAAATVDPQLPAALVNARQTLRQVQRESWRQERQAYEEELRMLTARAEVLDVRRDRAKLVLNDAQAAVDAWRKIVADRRQQDIEKQREQAAAELAEAPTPIKSLAARNAELATERARVAARIEALTGQQRELEAKAKVFESLVTDIGKAVNDENLRALIGPELNRLRTRLQDFRGLQREFRRVQQERTELQRSEAALELEGDALDDALEEARASLLAAGADPQRYESRLKELLEKRRTAIRDLEKDYTAALNLYGQLARAERALLTRMEVAEQLIAEHAVWLRSHEPYSPGAVPDVWNKVVAQFVGLPVDALALLRRNWPIWAGLAVALLLLIAAQRGLRRRLLEIRKQITKVQTDDFWLSIRALLDSVILALPVPALLAFLSWRADTQAALLTGESYEAVGALAAGFAAAARLAFGLALLKQFCRPNGLADAHFRFDSGMLSTIRWQLLWYYPVAVLLTLVVATMRAHADPEWQSVVGRLAFGLLMLATAVLAEQLLRPTGGMFANRFRRKQAGFFYHVRWLVYAAGLAAPVVLLGASLLGYHYAAAELFERVVATIWLLLIVVLVQQLALRAVFVAQRRLALEQARQRRSAAAAAAREAAEKAGSEAPATPTEPQEESFDLVTIGEQTRRLLGTLAIFAGALGLWLIWSDLIEALSFLKRYELWRDPSNLVTTADGQTEAARITLADLLLALVYTVVTFVLARNIPGLLEISILPRLPVDRGVRYAVTTLVRYTITLIGIVLAFGALGVGWSRVQWLAAAITVGLGFGLQEIFANFVSGLILLFERPIRVGDTVTVGGISGTVTRIRIRATTVMDWDRKELIIPNREFVTGQVMNWTLSDRVLRLVFPVGVAYGADTRRAKDLLEQIAASHEAVLSDPPPRAYFMGFGDSTLTFELRLYLRDLDSGLATRHELNLAIDDAFRAAGIEIAFPQRDLHVRSIAGLDRLTDVLAARCENSADAER